MHFVESTIMPHFNTKLTKLNLLQGGGGGGGAGEASPKTDELHLPLPQGYRIPEHKITVGHRSKYRPMAKQELTCTAT